jgi:putative ABC transport system permease protein
MNFVAWQMLTGDRAKYAGLVFAIAFSTFLMSHQMSIFVGLLNRTQSQIKDIADAGIWVMDPKTEYLDEVRALSNQDLYRVRGVEGMQWAVPLFKGNARVKAGDGQFRNAILMGLDDATLVGLPRTFLAGDWRVLQYPETIAIDEVGFGRFFPGQPYSTGQRLDIGDRTVTIGAVVRVFPPLRQPPRCVRAL